MRKSQRIIIFFMIMVIAVAFVTGCNGGNGKGSNVSEASAPTKINTLTELETATLGIVTGTTWDTIAKERFPDAERKYFNSSADALIALEQGKIDAYFADKTALSGMQWENHPVDCVDEPIRTVSNALIMAKEDYDENLLSQINTFIAKTKADGTIDGLMEKWFNKTEPQECLDYTKLTGENGTLRVAIGDSMKPSNV